MKRSETSKLHSGTRNKDVMDDLRTNNLLGALLTGLHGHLTQRIEKASKLNGDVPSALVTIAFNEGKTIEFLSKVLMRSHSWTVRLVAQMTQDRLIRKLPATDKRAVALFLTKSGKLKASVVLRARRHCLDEVLSVLSGLQQRQLTEMMESMLAVLTTDDDTAEAICKLCDVGVCSQERCPVTLAVPPKVQPSEAAP